MADSIAERMISLGNCFSSRTSLNARANSFFMRNLLPRKSVSYNMQKSGGCPLFGACDIDPSYKEDSSTEPARLQGYNCGMEARDLEKAALRGEPSYVWRAGQERRMQMILRAAGDRIHGTIVEN